MEFLVLNSLRDLSRRRSQPHTGTYDDLLKTEFIESSLRASNLVINNKYNTNGFLEKTHITSGMGVKNGEKKEHT